MTDEVKEIMSIIAKDRKYWREIENRIRHSEHDKDWTGPMCRRKQCDRLLLKIKEMIDEKTEENEAMYYSQIMGETNA